jgi:hypothetical protein
VRYTTFGGGWSKKEGIFAVLKVPRQCPLVLLVKAALMAGIRFFRTIFFNITPEGLHYGEIWTNIGRATLGRNFDVTIGRAACEACSATWNFGYKLSICSRIEENLGKIWSGLQVTEPCGCKLTSSQQSGIKYTNPNVSPYLCSCFIWKNLHICFFTYFFLVDSLDEQQTVVYNICSNCSGYNTSAQTT